MTFHNKTQKGRRNLSDQDYQRGYNEAGADLVRWVKKQHTETGDRKYLEVAKQFFEEQAFDHMQHADELRHYRSQREHDAGGTE